MKNASAQDFNQALRPGYDYYHGYGIVDAYRALTEDALPAFRVRGVGRGLTSDRCVSGSVSIFADCIANVRSSSVEAPVSFFVAASVARVGPLGPSRSCRKASNRLFSPGAAAIDGAEAGPTWQRSRSAITSVMLW